MFRDNAPAFIAALDDLCAVVHEASGALCSTPLAGVTLPKKWLWKARALYGSMGWMVLFDAEVRHLDASRTTQRAALYPRPLLLTPLLPIPCSRCATSTCGRITPIPARTSPRSTGTRTPPT